MSWVSAAVGVGTAVYGVVESQNAKKKAKQLQQNRPKLSSSPYTKDQISLMESELSTGMSGGSKAAYEADMDRSLSTTLDSLTKMGGSPNNVGDVFASNSNGRARLALMKDNLRMNQITNLSRTQELAEEERQQQFQFNEWAPFADQAQANAAARESSNKLVFEGLNTAASAAARGINKAKTNKELSVKNGDGGAGYSKQYYDETASNPNYISTANTFGGETVSSPAAGVGSINPNSSPSLLDSLLANQ